MACHSSVNVTSPQHVQFHCSGECSPKETCHVQITHLPHGGTRAWCGCTPEEPNGCHVVVIRTDPNAQPEVICAGTCATGHKCTLKRTIIGNNITFTCECEQG